MGLLFQSKARIMLIHCPNCNTEYDCEPGKYECECGAKFTVATDGTIDINGTTNQDTVPSQQAINLDIDKTIPPRQHSEVGFDIDATMPGKRERKPDGRFGIGDLILGRYKVLSELGQGGMGVVYKCFDEIAGIAIALKALPPELSHNTMEMEDVKENFQLVSKLVHQNIAISKNLERDNTTGNYYLIMECFEGEDLRRWIRGKRKDDPLTIETILPVIRQVAAALDYAHEQRIIHRDIKPGNIMIDAAGHVKVLDFGLAAQIHTSLTRVSMAYHGTSGTAPYMAPEQWRGRAQGAAADQYALAVMTYEMLAGHLPFESTDATVLREAVLNETAEPLQEIPAYAQQALERGMSKDPGDRFDSCSDFVSALEGMPVSKPNQRNDVWDDNNALNDSDFDSKRLVKMKRIAFVACGAAILVTVLVVLFFISHRNFAALPATSSPSTVTLSDETYLGTKAQPVDAESLYKLGLAYETGSGAVKNYLEAVKCFSLAAEMGHAGAQAELGLCYYNGTGVKEDYAEAAKWYRLAAEQGNAIAQYNLAFCYENGTGVTKNESEALEWYKKAAEQGYAKAQYELARNYCDNDNEAAKWYRRAAEQGNVEAQYELGSYFFRIKNYTEASKWLHKATDQGKLEAKEKMEIAELFLNAQNGNAVAQYNLGVLFDKGMENGRDIYIARNGDEALEWYKKAAEQGNVEAQYELGSYFFRIKNYMEASKWLHKATDQGKLEAKEKMEIAELFLNAQNGNAVAQYNLGVLFDKGMENGRDIYITEDEDEALEWYKKAAEQGNVEAQYALGECYWEIWVEFGDPSMAIEAAKWWRKAAEQGNVEALFSLGWYYFHEEKYTEASKWYRKAAEQGNVDAQFELGELFRLGKGVKKNLNEAENWYKKAAEQGHKTAAGRLEGLNRNH